MVTYPENFIILCDLVPIQCVLSKVVDWLNLFANSMRNLISCEILVKLPTYNTMYDDYSEISLLIDFQSDSLQHPIIIDNGTFSWNKCDKAVLERYLNYKLQWLSCFLFQAHELFHRMQA